MKTLFLSWRDPITDAWFPIGKLTHDGRLYHFVYIQGAIEAHQKADFQPIISFPDFYLTYGSPELFPLFNNRLLRSSRPDYPDFIQWLNLPKDKNDPIAILSRSGGKRETDTFEVFPSPELSYDGNYHIHFFVHGQRHLPIETQQHLYQLRPGQPLSLLHDAQNPYDSRALLIRTDDLHLVGYCPRYLTQDFFELVINNPDQVKTTIERINPPPTPVQFRFLCSLTAKWNSDFQPFSAPIYTPIASVETENQLVLL
jgi:HIRAN domain